jgi:hypothetical protein
MNTTQPINADSSQDNRTSTPSRRIAKACLASCRQLLSQMHKTRNTILTEFRAMVGANEHLLRLALNEAEALARQTPYPHLFFPVLALEKAESVRSWHERQQSLRHTQLGLSDHALVSTH